MYTNPSAQKTIDAQFHSIFGDRLFHIGYGPGNGIGVQRLHIPSEVAWRYRYDLRYTNTSGYAGEPKLALAMDALIAHDAIPQTAEEWSAFFECEIVYYELFHVFSNRWWRWQRDGMNIGHILYDVAAIREMYAALEAGTPVDHAALDAARIGYC